MHELDSNRRPFRERVESSCEATLGENCGMETTRELAELSERASELAVGFPEKPVGRLRVFTHGCLDDA